MGLKTSRPLFSSLNTTVQSGFLEDLQSLKYDNFNDVDIFIESQRTHLRHKCVIQTLSPRLYKYLNLNAEPNFLELKLSAFPTDIPETEIFALETVYSSNLCLDGLPWDTISSQFVGLLNSAVHSDVTFKVNGDIFKCHKCILSARSEFFSLMFNGNWMEKDADIIPLYKISTESFSIVLKFIYGDSLRLCNKSVIAEVIAISEMYNVSSLRRNLQIYFEANYCHFFHLPCELCIYGTADVIRLCKGFVGYENLVDHCYEWYGLHLQTIFTRQHFQKLPLAVKLDISKEIRRFVKPDTVLKYIKDCVLVNEKILKHKHFKEVKVAVTIIKDFSLNYLVDNFQEVVRSPPFLFYLSDLSNNFILREVIFEGLWSYLSDSNWIDVYLATEVFKEILKQEKYIVSHITLRSRYLSEVETIEKCERLNSKIKKLSISFSNKKLNEDLIT